MPQYMVLFTLDDEQVEHMKRHGFADWGSVGPHSDETHAQQFLQSLQITRKENGLEGDQKLHGLFNKGTDVIIGHTGTSPSGALNAQLLTGLWNAVYHQILHPPLGDERNKL